MLGDEIKMLLRENTRIINALYEKQRSLNYDTNRLEASWKGTAGRKYANGHNLIANNFLQVISQMESLGKGLNEVADNVYRAEEELKIKSK